MAIPNLLARVRALEPENAKLLAECESWRKQFRECAVELAAAESENAKLRAVAEKARNAVGYLPFVFQMEKVVRSELLEALAALETTNG